MVKREYLVLIAAFVWTAAGANILRLGIMAAISVAWEWWMALSMVGVFALFMAMFYRIYKKHAKRIYGYDGTRKHCILKFFDLKAYILMAVMMTGGILLRSFHIIPERCVAMFYTGLGTALTIAGVLFLIRFVIDAARRREGAKKPNKRKTKEKDSQFGCLFCRHDRGKRRGKSNAQEEKERKIFI